MRFANDEHTTLDAAALNLAGIDPNSTQPRTGPVPCEECRTPTWNLARGCDRHWKRPGVIDRQTIDLR